ncbi:TPA: hypothetical protein ACNUUK_004398, partial [Aeromonas salmonicida subsp. smithia]
MNLEKFSKIAESLRQYRRAELKDFEKDIGSKPIDSLYVDALPGDAVLRSVLSSNTTFLLGRKGTGKSTVFAKAQSELRSKRDIISVYIDVKSLCEVLDINELDNEELSNTGISILAYRAHLLRKAMLGRIISEMLKEISNTCERLTLLERWRGVRKQYEDLISSLNEISNRVKTSKLEQHEIPILQKISSQIKQRKHQENSQQSLLSAKGSAKLTSAKTEA